MASGAQDFHITVPAGGTRNISRQGEFVYLKAADRAVDVIMPNQTRVTMEAGDKLKQDVFNGFQVQNPDPLNPAALVFTVGMGDYWRQIVQGEISVVPGLRGADGTWRPDTRHEISLDLFPRISERQTFAAHTILSSVKPGNPYFHAYSVFEAENGLIGAPIYAGGNTNPRIAIYNSKLEYIREINTVSIYGTPVMKDLVYSTIHGYLLIGNGTISDATTGTILFNPPSASSGATTATRQYPALSPEKPGFIWYAYTTSTSTHEWTLLKLDEKTFETVETHQITINDNAQMRLRYDGSQNKLVAGIDGSFLILNIKTLTTEKTLNGVLPFNGYSGFVPAGRYLYSPDAIGDSPNLNKYVWEQFTVPLECTAIKGGGGGCVAQQIMGRNRSARLFTSANVSVAGTGDQLSVSGELIRFALENYFRAEVQDGYLDHVFDVTFSNPTSGGLALPISGGVNSLERQTVADAFTVYLPTSINLTIDARLSLGNGSQVQG